VFARLALLALLAVVLWAVLAHDTGAREPEGRYRVRPGDTLWSIAADRYGGDPREGVWRLRERNRLDGATIVPGQVLVLP
jgi:nucleoid-associated protein YgaU